MRPLIGFESTVARACDEAFMREALAEARRAETEGEVPVGAVVVLDGVIVGRGHNRPIALADPTAHAEVLALRAAGRRLGNYRLPGVTLYVTVEPCLMCCGAVLHARLGRLVYGARDPKAGAVVSGGGVLGAARLNHRVVAHGGVLAEACATMVRDFFRTTRGSRRAERASRRPRGRAPGRIRPVP